MVYHWGAQDENSWQEEHEIFVAMVCAASILIFLLLQVEPVDQKYDSIKPESGSQLVNLLKERAQTVLQREKSYRKVRA